MTATLVPASWTVRRTPVGPLLLLASDAGLLSVGFHAERHRIRRALEQAEARLGAAPAEAGSHPVLRAAAGELDAYFAGRPHTFGIPLDWSLTEGFTARVLRELAASVPYGSVITYQELADAVGQPGAVRAVGAAMGANPLPLVVPCHRVVATGGGLGGFSGGLDTKRALLALEGVLPAPLF
ncbi:methylated-DNA--[protein]-cysteine S-methyltransferase [Streptomyces sp. JJ66]|uniref:methylated-DNA--[protein]-cysteine S-methyltransferase n=1 Tax=Streptomyces sp. JJ66 TaxID=2803843 RepID=UPI001C55C55F|nr:methylated-DNA--[protein]-cysteine S-methyltransferase [Streptomyces sp. JJ66]MBW1602892.1 methylated-DNA--[protein]-cysteine S-methyltransferase [Streptomyces sp. JJ66]